MSADTDERLGRVEARLTRVEEVQLQQGKLLNNTLQNLLDRVNERLGTRPHREHHLHLVQPDERAKPGETTPQAAAPPQLRLVY